MSHASAISVCDLFVGLGGFSAGATAAGANVIMGVDFAPVPLRMWAANVPGGRAVLTKLGPADGDAISLPASYQGLHVHCSPPCTGFSLARALARGGSVTADGVRDGLADMRWCLDLVLERGDGSWSLENVSTPATKLLLIEYATRFPDRVAFATLDAADYGAPQTRKRLIAGPPELIRVLMQMPTSRRVSVREAFAARGLALPASHFKNQTRSRDGTPCLRSVEEPAFTVCASHALTWCSAAGQTVRVMTARESAVLMGFPSRWRLPQRSRDAQKAVGNALSCEMARAIVNAAASVLSGTPPPRPGPSPPPTPPTPLADAPLVRPVNDGLRRVRRRLRKIEGLLHELVEGGEGADDSGDAEDGE